MLSDKIIKCRDCGSDFTFTVSEQEFFIQKGFDTDPVRCQDCRNANKLKKDQGRTSFGR